MDVDKEWTWTWKRNGHGHGKGMDMDMEKEWTWSWTWDKVTDAYKDMDIVQGHERWAWPQSQVTVRFKF